MRFRDPHGERARLTDYERRQFASIEHDLRGESFDSAATSPRFAVRIPWRVVLLIAAVLFVVLGAMTTSGLLLLDGTLCAAAAVALHLYRRGSSESDG